MRRYKLTAALLSFALLQTLFVIPTAQAANKVWSTTTPYDTYNRPDLSPQFDILRVEVGLFDDDLDQIHFWIQFKNALLPSQFNDGLSSWAGILIDTNGDDEEDLRVETRNYSYTKRFGQPALASKNCTAVTWMDLDSGSDNVWLGFRVSQKCLSLPNKFRIQGYSDYKANDNLSFDYAPDGFATIDLGDYYNPKPKVTLPVPFSTSENGRSLTNYSSAPDNLAELASSLRDSVVTIECVVGESVGTGTAWAAKVQMPTSGLYQTYLITNYHVISDCIFKGSVDVILNNKNKVNGVLAAWDPDNDLAGIFLTTKVEPLLWQGATPLQGGWAGVLGSPKGLPGVLTTGIVSSVDVQEKFLTFTAPINPGNSGGPLFDSVGRVMGIVTAKARDSEGFGIANGVPLLCEVIIRCATGQSGWNGVPAKVSQDIPKKTQSLTFTANRSTFNYAEVSSLSIGFSASSSADLKAYSTSGLTPTISSQTPNICSVLGQSVRLINTGTCILRADQSGNSGFESANGVTLYIGLYFLKSKKTQFITGFASNVELSEGLVTLNIASSSNLPVSTISTTPKVCINRSETLSDNPSKWIFLYKAGTCNLTITQAGNDDFLPTSQIITFLVWPTETTITCIKKKLKLKVTDVKPKCPKGWTKKS